VTVDDHSESSALERTVPFLRCLICAQPLTVADNIARCATGHSFDIARQGYLSFLTGHAGTSTADTAEMVAARTRFLARGFYDAIADAVVSSTPEGAVGLALEIGGGTGFYLGRVLDSRTGLVGIDLDLSARALRVAARQHPRLAAIAADAWLPLPIADSSATLVLSVFAPRNPSEIERVLVSGGRLIIVSPSPRHLAELVSTLGLVTVDEHKTERLDRQFAGFEQLTLVAVEYAVELEPADIRDVVMMGPSALHVDSARLDAVDAAMRVTVSVELRVYTPQRMTPARGRMDE
jgi:23S rRNA (guanine745-N1)-methyltransferase